MIKVSIKYIFILSFILVISMCTAQTVLDLSVDHAAYPSVQYSVKSGYMTLYQNQTFQGNRAINREEMAIILYKLHQDSLSFKLNQTEIDSLSQLSLTFTPTIRSITLDFDNLNTKFYTLQEENKALHRDISIFQAKTTDLMKRLTHQRYWMYGLTVLSILNLSN